MCDKNAEICFLVNTVLESLGGLALHFAFGNKVFCPHKEGVDLVLDLMSPTILSFCIGQFIKFTVQEAIEAIYQTSKANVEHDRNGAISIRTDTVATGVTSALTGRDRILTADAELRRKMHIEGTAGKIVMGTDLPANELGVYKAQVEVNGIPKISNGGFSTFYPKDMNPQEVVDSINEAYSNHVLKTGNEYYGYSSNGMKITMYLDNNSKIISAFPER